MMPTDNRESPSNSAPLASPLQPDPLVELAARLAKKTTVLKDPELKADLLCRLGLLCWDVLGDLEAANKYLIDAGNAHPEAVRLRLHLAITTGDQKALRELQKEVGGELTDREAAGQFYRACAETWLFHFGDTEMAIQAAREGVRRNPGDTDTRTVLTLALELAGNLEGLVQHLRTAPGTDAEAHRRYATVAGDLINKTDDASKTLRRLRSKAPGDPYLLERICELADGEGASTLTGNNSAAELLRKKAELLQESGDLEALEATQYKLAELLLSSKESEQEAEAILDRL